MTARSNANRPLGDKPNLFVIFFENLGLAKNDYELGGNMFQKTIVHLVIHGITHWYFLPLPFL